MDSLDKELYIFWHIYVNPNRLDRCKDIVNRQYDKIKNSGLLERCTCIYIGYVSTIPFPLSNILKNKKIKILVHYKEGFEGVTTTALKKFCDERKNHNFAILYIHNRGATRFPDSPSEDWTLMMEYFCIENWKKGLSILSNKYTAGCEMWAHRSRIKQNDFIYHYSGNFWWARSDYIRLLKYPTFENRNEESEDWILQLADKGISKTKFGILHRTSQKKYERGIVHSYLDRYPMEYYKKANETPDKKIDKNLFHGEHGIPPKKIDDFTWRLKTKNNRKLLKN